MISALPLTFGCSIQHHLTYSILPVSHVSMLLQQGCAVLTAALPPLPSPTCTGPLEYMNKTDMWLHFFLIIYVQVFYSQVCMCTLCVPDALVRQRRVSCPGTGVIDGSAIWVLSLA